jgi:preprotein translocase subunit SecF
MEFEVPDVEYDEYSNRQLLVVPLALLAFALLVLVGWWAMTGAPVDPGIDFTGGSELRVETDMSQSEIRDAFDGEVASIQGVQAAANTYVLTFQSNDAQGLSEQAEAAGMSVTQSASTAASLAQDAQTIAIFGVVIAFVGMSLLVFALFRTFVPSIAVILSALSDILVPLAVMNLVGIQLSLGTVAALLMLIGYSVDSDILLNNHVLRRSGSFYESVYNARETGVTMTLTSIAAMTVMTVLATFFGISIMADIGFVLVVGLSADLVNTYLLNVTLLRWYKFEGVAR